MRVVLETIGAGDEPDAIVVKLDDNTTVGIFGVAEDPPGERASFERMLKKVIAEALLKRQGAEKSDAE